MILRGCQFHLIVLNVHGPTVDKIHDVKDSFYKELEHTFIIFPKYDMKMVLGDLNVKAGREDIFKQATGNDSLHKISVG
jgi:hypothetical protein